jgi:hypothetical protein
MRYSGDAFLLVIAIALALIASVFAYGDTDTTVIPKAAPTAVFCTVTTSDAGIATTCARGL